ncbi:arylsulfatase B-like [Sycon ciliatum]|uniref:arylsulfatase B-like n=1 Tax=Sycon ciliatum TaxID=27933 RepID=UPI0031F6EA35
MTSSCNWAPCRLDAAVRVLLVCLIYLGLLVMLATVSDVHAHEDTASRDNPDTQFCDADSSVPCVADSRSTIGQQQQRKEKLPSIVMVVVDDLGWNDMGYGGAEYNTTTVDGLAADGILLSQYYVQSTCSPSRSALLSGRYPFRDGLAHRVVTNGYPFGLPLSVTTLANALRLAGYANHAIGKWDVGMHERAYTPTRRGFDSFLGHYGAVVDHYTFMINADAEDNPVAGNITGRDLHVNEAAATDIGDVYSTELYGQRAVELIDSHDFDAKPLFMYLAYTAVHSPLQVPAEDTRVAHCEHVAPMKRKLLCGMLQALDDSIADVVSALKRASAWENTVFIFTTDNGGQATEGSSNYPLRGNKRTMFEGGVRGTAFVHYPQFQSRLKGSTSNALMHLVDWLPTLTEGVADYALASIPNLQSLDGMNIWPALTTGSTSPRSEILLNLDPPADASTSEPDGYIGQAALRFEEWKLIVGLPNCSVNPLPANALGGGCPSGWLRPGSPDVETEPRAADQLLWLFDLDADPEENNDLSEALPGIVAMMREKLSKYPKVVQTHVPFDPKSDPQRFNGYWTPWLD